VAEDKEVTGKMGQERMNWVESSMEREKRSGKVVEMVMDSQGEGSGKEWKEEEVMKDLRVAKGAVEKVVVKGKRVKVVLKDSEVADGIVERIEKDGEKIMGGGIVEVKRNENWVG